MGFLCILFWLILFPIAPLLSYYTHWVQHRPSLPQLLEADLSPQDHEPLRGFHSLLLPLCRHVSRGQDHI